MIDDELSCIMQSIQLITIVTNLKIASIIGSQIYHKAGAHLLDSSFNNQGVIYRPFMPTVPTAPQKPQGHLIRNSNMYNWLSPTPLYSLVYITVHELHEFKKKETDLPILAYFSFHVAVTGH